MSRAHWLLLAVGAILAFMWWRQRGPKLTLLQGGLAQGNNTGMPNTDAGSGTTDSYTPLTAELQRLRLQTIVQRAQLSGGSLGQRL
jgi:hypothetical protein